jgi:hypothetical protein
MARYQGDPRWLTARFAGTCSRVGCTQAIKSGDQVFYYPQGRIALAKACGHADDAARDFNSHAADEDGGY